MSMIKFLSRHKACQPGLAWATSTCDTMQEAWSISDNAEFVIWAATRPRVLTPDELREALVFVCDSIQNYVTDDRSIAVVAAIKGRATTPISSTRLTELRRQALDAVHESARNCDLQQVNRAAIEIAYAATWDSNCEDMALLKVAAILKETMPSVLDALVKWLKENTTPNFE